MNWKSNKNSMNKKEEMFYYVYKKKIEELYKFAEKLNLKLHISIYDIFVVSNKGNWRIEVHNNGIILWHENFIPNRRNKSKSISNCYHLQRSHMPNIEEALKYIINHDNVRYTLRERYSKVA